MGWFDKLVWKAPGSIFEQRDDAKKAAKKAKKAVREQVATDAREAYEEEARATVNANSQRAVFRSSARANVLGSAATSAGVRMGAPAPSAGAAPGVPASGSELARIVRNIRSFPGGMR
jgi:hypothetical protein